MLVKDRESWFPVITHRKQGAERGECHMDNSSNQSIFLNRVEQAAKVMQIPVSDLLKHLSVLGIDKDDKDAISLLETETTCEGDARAIMVEGKNAIRDGEDRPQLVKIARFKAGWSVIKGKVSDEKESSVEKIVAALRPVRQWSNQELLEKYTPDAPSEVLDELKSRSKGRNFIVFDGDNVDVDNSKKMLSIASRQETPNIYQLSDGDVIKATYLYRVGEFPMLWMEECPIQSNSVLVDGFCEKCGSNWKNVPNDKKVIVRVANDIGLLANSTQMDFINIIKNVDSFINGWNTVPKFLLKYKELIEESKLPVLKKRVSKTGNSDPFFVHKSY